MNFKLTLIGLLAIAALSVNAASPTFAEGYKVGKLTVNQPWARPSIGNIGNSAAFMAVTNAGGQDDILVSVATPIARNAELHNHIMEGNVMKMRRVKDGITVPANGSAELKPGGLHVMLLGLNRKVGVGDSFPMTLTFSKAGEIAVEVKVLKSKPAEGHKHH